MKHVHREDLALRRDALRARAALQRLQIASSVIQLRSDAVKPKAIVGLALRLAGSWLGSRAGARDKPGTHARPWMLSAGWLLVRALRSSPTARWLAGAGAAGVAIWWVVQALRRPAVNNDDSG